jgi:quercetin dioxygenase-like cupin family protein
MAHKYYPNPLEKAVFSAEGPQPQTLFASGPVKVIVAGVEAGSKIPVHPEGLSSFHFMEGKGVMIVDGERLPVGPGVVIIAEHGAQRGMEAGTRPAFVAVRITELDH